MQFQRAFGPDDEGGGGDLFVEGPLGSDALINGLRAPAALGEAGALSRRGTGDANRVGEVFGSVGLKKERDDNDAGRLGVHAPLLNLIEPALTDAGVENGFKTPALFGTGKNDSGEITTAQGAGGIDDVRTKGGADFVESGLAGGDEIAGEFIGINDGEAAAGEDGSGGGFTHADAAGEANDNHAGEVIGNQAGSNKGSLGGAREDICKPRKRGTPTA
jgi:hypothetical protein